MTTISRAIVLPVVLAAVMTLAGCPAPEIDMRAPGVSFPPAPSHTRPPVR